ncbi:hypothetical protein BGX31_010553 [Mortierella sp. GBA43]|nr:hypothetical protein BGX31_010553 [Mortierella sp. GBA43]
MSFRSKKTSRKSSGGTQPNQSSSTSTAAATSANVEGAVVYRKVGSKIEPVTPASDQIKAPVSGLFSQHGGLSETGVESTPSESTLPKAQSNPDLDSLSLRDVLPPDEFLKKLIESKEGLNLTVQGTKELVQPVLDVLPLAENDPKRVKVEKEFLKECKKKDIPIRDLAAWSLQFSRDGAPLTLALYKIMVDDGDLISRYSYGTMLYRGAKGVPRDPVKGRKILESMAKPHMTSRARPFPWAQMTLGGIYAREDKDFEAAREMYQAAANAGLVEGRVSLGRMYYSGELPKDIDKAKSYFEQAIALEDNAEAHFLLGVIELEQQEKPDKTKVFTHYEKAASKGLPEAQYNLGVMYFRGDGMPKNDILAVEYWKMAGEQGYGLAQLSLGAYYFQDETPQTVLNPETGETKTIQHEWDPSQKDLMQAQKWFTLASRRPGDLGLEGARLKAQVDESIKKGGGGRRRNGQSCTIL